MKNNIISKEDIKTILTITFVVVELLSLLFNSFFVKINIGSYYFTLNYSVVFFCIGFFIVDIINDFFSFKEAYKFFYYKIYSQLLFLSLSYSAINVYGLENTMIAKMVYESPWTIFSGIIATYFGYKVMGKIMDTLKLYYQGSSVFRRYICSTLPGEILFSFIFSILSFSYGRNFNDVLHIFTASCMAKIVLSVVFSIIISFLLKIRISNSIESNTYSKNVKTIY
ncbi:MAG: VUT family protein [Tatlockia sp.]|nr:VUT family protein [Tatlockia sp.]